MKFKLYFGQQGLAPLLAEAFPQFIDRQLDRLRLDGGTARAMGFLASCLDGDGYLRIKACKASKS